MIKNKPFKTNCKACADGMHGYTLANGRCECCGKIVGIPARVCRKPKIAVG